MTHIKPELKAELVEVFKRYGLTSPVWVFGKPNNKQEPLRLSLNGNSNPENVIGSVKMLNELEEMYPQRTVLIYELSQIDGTLPMNEEKQRLAKIVFSGEKIYEGR